MEIDGEQRANITALAWPTAPAGHAKWSVRLLAEKVVELDDWAQISYSTVNRILKKTS